MSTLLQIEDLRGGYGPTQVLKDVTLEVKTGEIVALIGANGAGKTTVLNTVMGFLSRTSGRVIFDGESILGWMTQQIVQRGITQVPERRQLFDSMSVEENLLLGAYTRKKGDGAAIQADLEAQYTLFPVLKGRRRQLAGSLSGGEQQMLAIARAMMSRPRLFLMDEPSLGLAPLLIKDIMRQIRQIRDRGGNTLLVEQNARAGLEISDRAYLLETGRITLSGTAEEFLRNPQIEEAYLGGEGSHSRAFHERIRQMVEKYRFEKNAYSQPL